MAEQYADVGEVRGYVPQQVIRANLNKDFRLSTSKNKLRVADVGGGEGHDSEWAARFGHEVTLIEQSRTARRAAEKRARQARRPFTVIPGDAQSGFEEFGQRNPFDLVLSHSDLGHQDDPRAHLRYLAGMLDKQGSISVLTTGLAGAEAHHLGCEDLENVESLQAAGQYMDTNGARVKAYSSEQLTRLIKLTGFNLLGWYGVGISEEVSQDTRKIADVDQVILDAIVAGEVRLSRAEDSRGIGQALQVVARKK